MNMDHRNYIPFENKTAVVTGAASGIGKALAVMLGRAGAYVYALDLDEDGLREVSHEKNISGVLLDVADPVAYQSCVNRIILERGGIDYLFNNAGITLLSDTRHVPFSRWKAILDVNVMGVCNGIAAVYPRMVSQGHGHIINTSSVASVTGYATSVPYTCSKSFVTGLSRSLLPEAKRYNVNVSLVFPGYVKTNIFSDDRVLGADPKSVFKKMPFKAISPEKAAAHILTGTLRRKKKIIFPFSAKCLWFLAHWAPAVLRPFHKGFLKPFREAG